MKFFIYTASFILLVMVASTSIAQDTKNALKETNEVRFKAQEIKAVPLSKKHEGTYQLQVVNSREFPCIPVNLDEIIEKNRHTTETRYVNLGTMVKLKILPLSEINRATFIPIENTAYISK